MTRGKLRVTESRRMSDLYGYCDPATGKIVLRAGMSQFDRLGTLVHEGMHCALPTTTEEEVDRISRILTALLWQQGYRRRTKKS